MKNSTIDCFFELIQISLGNKEQFEKPPSDDVWNQLYKLAVKHSVVGVLFCGLEKAINISHIKKPSVFYLWFSHQQQIQNYNTLQNKRAEELSAFFQRARFKSCILKGQGTAAYYDNPSLRQCGDIDIWVDGKREDVLLQIVDAGYKVNYVDIKNAEVHFFEDVPVEVHFRPSSMYNPFVDRKLQRYFKIESGKQFSAYDGRLGFAHTTNAFDLVYSLIHIYRHVFSEGIGLRQLIDYYYILLRSNKEDRTKAFRQLCELKMMSFVGGIMYILLIKLGIKENYLLCTPNIRHGCFLLNEIMIGGNFGKYDTRMRKVEKEKRFKRGIVMFNKNLRFLRYYPSEVLWSPLWKLWHYCWRKEKGYL